MRLVLSVHPEWEGSEGPIDVSRFTDGITNTVRLSCVLARTIANILASSSLRLPRDIPAGPMSKSIMRPSCCARMGTIQRF